MNKIISFFIVCSILFLFNSFQSIHRNYKQISKQNYDTLVISYPLKNQLAGANYRSGGRIYQTVINQDTIGFFVYISEYSSGKLSLEYRIENLMSSHRENMILLKKILGKAQEHYSLDSLRSIYLGRLISKGDLAIEVSKQYRKKFGKSTQVKTNKVVNSFLLTSKIATDFNELLSPYHLKVNKISAEKIFFASLNECKRYSKIETDSLLLPQKILDGMVYVNFVRMVSEK